MSYVQLISKLTDIAWRRIRAARPSRELIGSGFVDHISLAVSDLAPSKAFYDAA